jgi:hypothetical protein
VAESRTIEIVPVTRRGSLTLAELAAIAPSIRALRADPDSLDQLVGDTLRVTDHVRILALDSLGALLGELPVYDFEYVGRGFRLLRDGRVHLSRRGTVRLRVIVPKQYWLEGKRERPETTVAIVVHSVS